MIDHSCLTARLVELAFLQQNNGDHVAQHTIAHCHSRVLSCNMPYLSVTANALGRKKSQFAIVFRSSS